MRLNSTPRMGASMLVCATLAASAGTANAELVYGVNENQTLLTWDSATPNNVTSGLAISGLAQNESVRGIDFRPATGELYALGSFSNLYTIDVSTGMASLVGAGAFSPALNGSTFGFDFNPTIDKIRVVSEVNQNLVLDPDAGTSTGVTDLFYDAGDPNEGVDPNVAGSAYTNSFDGATMTQLYGIDSGLDILVTQANSAGTLQTVGSLGTDVNDTLSFDISGASGVAFLSVQDLNLAQSTFWTIDLATGDAMMIGEVGGGALITSIAVVPSPASAGAIAVLGLSTLARRRRR